MESTLVKGQFMQSMFNVYFFSHLADWIDKNVDPSEIFTEQKLCRWAKENGYKKE